MNWKKHQKLVLIVAMKGTLNEGRRSLSLFLSLTFVELLILKMVIVNLQMGLIYGCPVEDLLTGLAIQCRDRKSLYYNPERGILGC